VKFFGETTLLALSQIVNKNKKPFMSEVFWRDHIAGTFPNNK
jgi:hypothetical protein